MSPYRKFSAAFLESSTLSSLSVLLLEQLTGGIYLYSRSRQKLIFHNKEFENLTGISANELRKHELQTYQNSILEDDLVLLQSKAYPCIRELLQSTQDSPFSVYKYSFNYRIKTRPGKVKHLLHQTTVLEQNMQNEPDVLLAHISDISEYKKDPALLLVVSAYDYEKKKWKKLLERKFLHNPKQLSARETTLLQLLANGYTQRDIGVKLHISYFTVRAHCRNILEKTGCRSIRDLKQKCHEEGWA